MAETTLEYIRSSHEEVEKLERLVAMEHKKSTTSQSSPSSSDRHGLRQLFHSHRIRDLFDRIIDVSRRLADGYERQAHSTADIDLFDISDDPFVAFYSRLAEIRRSRNYCNNQEAVDEDDDIGFMLPTRKIQFTGEECFGRYVDLHEFYGRFTSFAGPLDYFSYLDQLCSLANNDNSLPKKLKAIRQYRGYLTDLLQYLVSFLDRTKPFTDLDSLFRNVEAKFEEEHRDRYHSKKGKQLKAALLMEAKVNELCELLKETILRTKERVKNRSAMSAIRELEDDLEGDELDQEDDEDDEVRNPSKLPLGWDGKPIPFWLYKLHGLSQEFKCEICGDFTYRGRREFERHFGEQRHQLGMLGIPSAYSKCFHEITEISDAQKLWEEIRRTEKLCKWKPEVDEELEDDDGNVYDKKSYSDLKKAGLDLINLI